MIIGALILLIIYLCSIVVVIHIKKDNSVGNFTWGGGCILAALYTLFITSTYLARHILITALVILWGMRLTLYLISRYKKGADPRFVEWQIKQGTLKAWFTTVGWIFGGQTLLLFIMASPIVVVNISSVPGPTILDFFGLSLWCIGFIIESIADYQLYTFLQNQKNKGNVLDSGLWYYSRHPNYFGEIIMWWSIYLIALNVPYGWATIIAPITITGILRFYSIPLLEHAMADNKAYQGYKKRTPIFIPKFWQ